MRVVALLKPVVHGLGWRVHELLVPDVWLKRLGRRCHGMRL